MVDAWGFEHRTILTWVKGGISVGNWLRQQTEHCIVARRGKPTVRLSGQSTVLRAKARGHSRKPEAFYEMVEGLCPGRRWSCSPGRAARAGRVMGMRWRGGKGEGLEKLGHQFIPSVTAGTVPNKSISAFA